MAQGAIVPRYGRRVSPAGPASPYGFHVSLYNQGLGAWEQAVNQIGGELARQDAEIRAARESTDLVARSSQFALDLNTLLTQTAELTVDGRPATPQEQEQHFKTQVDLLGRNALNWKGASPTAQARLQQALTEQTAQQIVVLRRMNRQREIENMRDNLELARQTTYATGSEVPFRTALSTAAAHGVISEAMATEEAKNLPNNLKIEQLRRAAGNPKMDPEKIAEQALALQSAESVTLHQRERLREVENIASAQKVSIDKAKAQLSDEELNKLLAATRTQPLGFVLTKIGQSDKLTEIQKITAAKAVNAAAELWSQKKVNPWEDTQDYPALMATLRKISTGEITTPDGVTAEMLRDGTVHWKLTDQQMALRVLDAKYGGYAGDNPADPVATQYVDTLMNLWLDKDGQTDSPAGLALALRQVLDASKRNANDPNAMEKEVAPIIEKAKEHKAKRLLTGWAAVRKAMDYTFGRGGRNRLFTDLFTGNYMMGTEPQVTTPQNQAEFDALPVGAHYIDKNDGQEYVKQ